MKISKNFKKVIAFAVISTFALYLFIPSPKTFSETRVDLSVKLDVVNVSSFDTNETRAAALLNNVVLVINDSPIIFDASKSVIENGAVVYVDGDLSVTISNALTGGVAVVTVVYQDGSASVNFTIVVAAPPVNPDGSEGKGNVHQGPAVVSPVRKITIKAAETPEDKTTTEKQATTSESVAVKPEDVATPVNNPTMNEKPVDVVAYNKISIAYADGTKLSLFSEGEGSKIIILSSGDGYVNAMSGNEVEFTITEASDKIVFEMTEYDSLGDALATSSGTYSK